MAARSDDLEHMTAARRERLVLLARIISGLTVLGIVVGLWLSTIDREPTDTGFVVGFTLFPIVGYLMATRRPENSLGWLMVGIGVAIGLGSFLQSYAGYAVNGGIGGRQLGLVAESLNNPMWVPVVGLPATFLLLLFPDGHLPSPRWRWFARILAASLALIWLTIVLSPGKFGDQAGTFANYRNPLGLEALRPVITVAVVSIAMLPIGVVGSLVALVRRFRRSTGIERLQLRWLVTAATFVGVMYTLALLIGAAGSWGANQPAWMTVLQNISIFSFGLIPIAIGVSVLRYHLFDIDLVINRALLFGALAVFITVGLRRDRRGHRRARREPCVIRSCLRRLPRSSPWRSSRSAPERSASPTDWSTASEPNRTRCSPSSRSVSATSMRTKSSCRGWRARSRAAPGRSERTSGSVSGTSWSPEATWPHDAEPLRPIAADEDDPGDVSASEMREPIRHQGELLGALSIVKRPGESISPTEEKLVRNLAGQVGLVMRNVALTEQLMDHIEQLRASRQRLVTRRTRSGASSSGTCTTARSNSSSRCQCSSASPKGSSTATRRRRRRCSPNLQAATGEAIEDLRDLARGIYPPLLADKGLVAALEAQARKGSVATDVRGRERRRATPSRWRRPSTSARSRRSTTSRSTPRRSLAEVRLAQSNGDLTFEVSDDGAGFDMDRTSYGTGLRGMADRVEAIGGTLEIRSTLGGGTSVAGRIPAAALPELPGLPSS